MLMATLSTPSAVESDAAIVITIWSLALLYGPTWNVSPAYVPPNSGVVP